MGRPHFGKNKICLLLIDDRTAEVGKKFLMKTTFNYVCCVEEFNYGMFA